MNVILRTHLLFLQSIHLEELATHKCHVFNKINDYLRPLVLTADSEKRPIVEPHLYYLWKKTPM